MHEIEMLGLLDHDVLSSIELPFLPEPGPDPINTPQPRSMHASFSTLGTTTGTISSTATNNEKRITKAEAEKEEPRPTKRRKMALDDMVND